MTATPADVHVEVTDLDEPNPAGLQITARLIRNGGTRELSVKFGPDADLPDEAEILAYADRLADQVWGESSHASRPNHGGRGARDRRAQARGGFLPAT